MRVRFRWRMGRRLMLIAMIAHCDRTRRRGRLRASHAHRHQRERQNHQELQDGGHAYDISMVCADVELHYAILDRLGDGFFADRYNIGIWAWELPKFPEKWYDRFAFYDEVWVGSSFVADALAAVSPIQIGAKPRR